MINELLLHELTRGQLEAAAKDAPHAILLIGPPGSGKKTLSLVLAAEIAGISPGRIENHPALIKITRPEDKTEIPIDSIRGLIRSLSLRTTEKMRVVVINEAASLSDEAQNSLLKLIEEPPLRTVFILCAPALSDILPTVASRAQKVNILPVTQSQAAEYFGGKYDKAQITSAWLLGRAGAGSINAILERSTEHQLKKAVESAKKFLGLPRYERLLFIDSMAASKPELETFVDALDRVLSALAVSDIKNGRSSAKRVLAARRQLNAGLERLSGNTNPKLIALDLALNLSV